jgi:hypothetical protein
MKKKLKKLKISYKRKKYNFYMLFVILVILFLSVGYSALNSSVTLTGGAEAIKYGDLFISGIEIVDSNSVVENSLPVFEKPTLTTSLNFGDNSLAYITYHVTVANGSNNAQKYTGSSFNVDSSVSNIISYEVSGGLTENEYLAPGESTTFTLTYKYVSGATSGIYNLITQFNFTDCGTFFGYKKTDTADLTTNTLVPINIKVVNGNSSSLNYTVSLNNSKFMLADANGNAITSFSIEGNSQTDLVVYLKSSTGAVYYKSSYVLDLTLATGSTNIDLGNVTATVTPTYGYTDEAMVSIGAISLSLTSTVGSYDVNWSRTDTGGSDITNYVIKIYNTANNLVATGNTNSSSVTYRFINQSPGTYYAQVYGVDAADNTGESYCSSATTTSTYCRKSSNTEIRWAKTVTYTLTNLTSNGSTTANYGSSLSFTLTAATNYTLPTSITVTMGGTTLTSGTGYTYSSSTGNVTISNVTGDIVVTAAGTSSTCLVKGTKVLLANGNTKNIEDINYDDLLKVWSFTEGRYVNVYPIWIEHEGHAGGYQLNTFSDGTTLKTVGYHGIFSVDANKFVSVDDKDNFKVGTKVLKKDGDGFKTVTVTNIELIPGTISYYQVVSSIYYNIISDGFMTTDGNTILVNSFDYDNNLIWKNRNSVISNQNNLFSYDDLKDTMPYYMFLGLRASEVKYIANLGYFDLNKIDYLKIKLRTVDKYLLKEPIIKDNNRVWMVTTSKDIVTEENKNDYLVKEGSIYTLPIIDANNFKGWYNTADNKLYQGGDKVTIWYGTYFEEVEK